ncbi:MAG: lipopolysaccharide biosynthesis protein [Cyclobacteriaceae bacterium]|nr:lipopolysaccharide biosynthesis protein [Cyclobacteriaceae bacterium]
MSLGKKVFSSAVLLFIRKIWGNAINLVVMAFLARLLSKEDFGLLAISSVFLGIINTLATSGIAEYIVYYDGDDRDQKINAAFWLNLLLTLAVIAIVAMTGPVWADFYQNEKIYSLLLLLSVSFFFEMSSTVPRALLRKELEYKTLVYYSSISMTVVSVGKLVAAWLGFGVYSLALPQAIVSPLLMTSFFLKKNWKPYTHFGIAHFKAIVKYCRHIIGGRILAKLVNEGDNLIVGKFIGLDGLGIYALAFQLANLVTTNVVVLVSDIFLPLLSKVKGDIERLRQLYGRMIQFLSFISFPLTTALVIGAEPIVYFIYGEKWLDAVVPFQILCAFALGRSLSSPSSSLFNAMGRPDIGFKFTLYFTPVFLASVFLGSQFGVIGVALATTVVRVLGSVISLNLSLNLIQLQLTDLYRIIKSNLISTFVIVGIFSWSFYSDFESEKWILLFLIPFVLYFHILFQRFLFYSQVDSFFLELKKNMNYGHEVIRKFFFLKNQYS